MKKLISSIIFLFILLFVIIFFIYGKKILYLLDEKKVYRVKDIENVNIETLGDNKFFNNGIITYNNQKIFYYDYSGNLVWSNEDSEFLKQVFVIENGIFINVKNTIEILDKNNQKYVIPEIDGDIVNVSRENHKIFMITKNGSGQNSLYIMNENNELEVDNKNFEDNITGVSISDKSEAYSIITLKFNDGVISNSIYFNLLDDVELWSADIDGEILIKTKIVNNNVIAIGTKNVYYFNTNGKLMWKNSIYNKITDCAVSKENKRIYILYEKDGSTELISYNFEGKISSIYKTPAEVKKIKAYKDMLFVYNDKNIYLAHGTKIDKVYEDSQSDIFDFITEDKNIRILSKNKLVTGQLK